MTIIYNQCCPEIDDIIAIYQSSGIKRPIHDVKRIREMYRYANLVITAWDDGKPVGIAGALTKYATSACIPYRHGLLPKNWYGKCV